jgi:S1-C subfamily serine protease
MTRPFAVGFVALALLPFGIACGGAPTTKSAAVPKATMAASAEKAGTAPSTNAEGPNSHALRRSVVRGVVKGGLGLLLQKVALDDEPVLKNGHFHGFRITALHDPAFWNGIDVHAGDVIMRVNGMPIEHPEEALEAFHSLESATELRVFYERDGSPKELTYAIIDDEPQKRADASAP